jgi:rhomboid family GlyGly-CTERM serine protease
MDQSTHLTAPRLPGWTLVISAFALIIFFFPTLGNLLIYDRAAIIHGEIWRLLTGNLVHFSITHLVYNLIAWLIAGTIIEFHGYRFFPALCLSSSIFIGVTLFILEPELYFYAGLSGMVSAAVTYLCLHGIGEKGIWRWLCAATLTGLITKTVIEMRSGSSFMLLISEENFAPVPLSHLAGIIAAIFLFFLLRTTIYLRHSKR